MTGKFTVVLLALALLGGMANAQNVTITLTPQGIPIQIPGSGGSFNYTIAATNNGTSPQQATVWCMVTLPNGNPYGPVLGPATVTLNPSQTISRLRTQNVPAGAPAGNYVFNAYIGVYSSTVWDSASFPFEKQAAGGTPLWVARYNGPSNQWDQAYSMAVDSEGNVVVTGFSAGASTDNDAVTIKYNSAGVQQWLASYNGPTNEAETAYAIVLDGAGNVYVTGSSASYGTTWEDYFTVKYNAAGVQQWVAIYAGLGPALSDEPLAVAVDGDGNVYVTGYSGSGTTGDDYATIKYDSSGNQLWVARYNSSGSLSDWAYSLAVDGSGNVYVTGYSEITPWVLYNAVTIKYNSAGVEQWVASYQGPANLGASGRDLAVDGNGNVYVAGSAANGGLNDFATLKYDPSGTLIWQAFYNGPDSGNDYATGMVLDGSGYVYVTGASDGSGTDQDFATIKYDASGNQLWAARYNGPANYMDYTNSIAVDGSGNVYVTGWSMASWATGGDYGTIKYDASGNQIWVATYNGPGSGTDEACCLGLDAAGNVYVTGYSDAQAGGSDNFDYCTIKYSGGNLDNWMSVEATVFGQPLPQESRLEQNYPNPFNAETAISYQLSADSHVSLRVYDMAGRLVETLVDGWRSAGMHELTFDAGDLPSGMYLARLEAGEFVGVQKLTLLK